MTQRNVGQGPGDFGAERVEVLVILMDAHEPRAGWSKVWSKSHIGHYPRTRGAALLLWVGAVSVQTTPIPLPVQSNMLTPSLVSSWTCPLPSHTDAIKCPLQCCFLI